MSTSFTEQDLRARNHSMWNFDNIYAHIIGCGAIGSFTASTLARMGVAQFDLIDPDTVDKENIGVQDFTFHQLGMHKTAAVAQNIRAINPTTRIVQSKGEFNETQGRLASLDYVDRHAMSIKHIIVIAVDSMKARLDICQNKSLKSVNMELEAQRNAAHYNRNLENRNTVLKNSVLFDARMGSETFQLYKFPLPLVVDDYMKTWYSDEDGDPEPCSARSTAYCSTFAGSIISSEIKKLFSGGLAAEKIIFGFPALTIESETDFSVLQK